MEDTETTPATETEIETPFERVYGLSEHVAEREFTANQERVRFIAQDVRDYAEKAPTGLGVNSRTIKRDN